MNNKLLFTTLIASAMLTACGGGSSSSTSSSDNTSNTDNTTDTTGTGETVGTGISSTGAVFSYEGTLDADGSTDHENFSFTAETDGTYAIVLEGPEGADFDVSVEEAPAYVYVADGSSDDADEVAVFDMTAGNTYWIYVDALSGSGDYTVFAVEATRDSLNLSSTEQVLTATGTFTDSCDEDSYEEVYSAVVDLTNRTIRELDNDSFDESYLSFDYNLTTSSTGFVLSVQMEVTEEEDEYEVDIDSNSVESFVYGSDNSSGTYTLDGEYSVSVTDTSTGEVYDDSCTQAASGTFELLF